MAPERPGMLSVLDLSYKNGDLESRTETYRVETNEMLTESAGKLRVESNRSAPRRRILSCW
jgi:hypothetical protein